MKKLMVLLFAIMILSASLWSQTGIEQKVKETSLKARKILVTYPNGGQEWFVGKEYQVRWDEWGINSDIKHVLFVYPSGPEWDLGTVKKDKKHLKYFYTILPKFSGYNQYKIRVMTPDGSIQDESDQPFTIKVKRIIKTKPPLTAVKPINILYPRVKDRVCWKLGREYDVRVKVTTQNTIKIKIKLEGPGGTIESPPQTVMSTRTIVYPLTVPDNYPQGYYKLTVYNVNDPSACDTSRIEARRNCKH